VKRVCACGRLVEKGQQCVCKIKRAATADAARPSPAERGYDAEWRELRAAFIKANPMCVKCGDPAKHVDHVLRASSWRLRVRATPSHTCQLWGIK
jgi:5-methylcytosine-specific restriction protein A